MSTPEELARQNIDALLEKCGWTLQNRSTINLDAARGIAIREGLLKDGEADCLLFADRKAVGTIEAKPEGSKVENGASRAAATWMGKRQGRLSGREGVKGFYVDKRDRLTRKRRWEMLDEDLAYEPNDLDRAVVAPDQIRTVMRTFREELFTDIFPGRTTVPKTLIFAKDDSPVDDIVRIVTELERHFCVIEELEALVSANLHRASRLRQAILHDGFCRLL